VKIRERGVEWGGEEIRGGLGSGFAGVLVVVEVGFVGD